MPSCSAICSYSLASSGLTENPSTAVFRAIANWYRAWAGLAEALAADPRAIRRITSRHERVVERLLALPQTLIHGELFPANVVMQGGPGGWRPVVLDWESAAIGCSLTDLACLTAGGWTDDERAQIVQAYAETTADSAAFDPTDLAWCRLQLAIQWLGWPPGHDGPPEQRNDWLREATVLADTLGL